MRNASACRPARYWASTNWLSKSFPQWVRLDKSQQLRYDVVGQATRELGIDQILLGLHAEFVESNGLAASPLFECELTERWPPPEVECGAERLGGVDCELIVDLLPAQSGRTAKRVASRVSRSNWNE